MSASPTLRQEDARTGRESTGATPSAAARDTAGVVAPPPLIYAAGLLAGLVLEALLPSFDFPRIVAVPGGSLLVGGGIALGAWFIASFRRAQTPVDPRRPTSAIVTSGPFRLSRNPAYLSLALIYAGVALLIDAPWAFAALVGVLVVIRWGVIAREERYLERRFGEPYLRYKASTRRWL